MPEAEVVPHGTVAPGFEGVGAAFTENFSTHGEKGASLAIYVDGEKKVDLWGGVADIATGRPWAQDTLGIVYSATKGATAILGHLIAQRGELDFDAPVTRYWPEFGGAGKSNVPVRYLFTHQVGLPFLDQTLTREEVLDGRRIVEILERETPIWEPGTAHGYHALTYGWLIGTLVLKIRGKSLGEVFQEEIARPLGIDFHIGLPTSEIPRVAQLVNPPPPQPNAIDAISDPTVKAAITQMGAAMMDPNSNFSRTLSTNGALPTPDAATWNAPAVYQSEIPAANGISNGASMAKLYAATLGPVDGVQLLSEETVAAAVLEQVNGPDRTLFMPSRFATGFMLNSTMSMMLSESSFGHTGAGGALGFADTEYNLALGYVQNQLGGGAEGDPRMIAILGALREALF